MLSSPCTRFAMLRPGPAWHRTQKPGRLSRGVASARRFSRHAPSLPAAARGPPAPRARPPDAGANASPQPDESRRGGHARRKNARPSSSRHQSTQRGTAREHAAKPPPRSRGASRSANKGPGGAQRGPGHGSHKQPRVEPSEPLSLGEWIGSVRGACSEERAKPVELLRCLQGLRRVPRADVQGSSTQVERALESLVAAVLVSRDKMFANKLDALGTAVQAHECLAHAVTREGELSKAVGRLITSAAQRDDTYADPKSASQMVTAQLKLALYCAEFWQRLESTDLSKFGGREVATLLHRSVKMTAEQGAPQPSAQLWEKLLRAVRVAAARRGFGAQAIANSLWACGKAVSIGVSAACASELAALQRECTEKLLQAAVHSAGQLSPQAAANVWWALSALELQPQSEQRLQILAATLRTAPGMKVQEAVNTVLAFARLGVPLSGKAGRAALAAVVRRAADMNAQEVANVWWALGDAGLQPSEALAIALLAASERAAPSMKAQEVSNTLWGMGRLHVEVPAAVQSALWEAVQWTAPSLKAQECSNTLLGVAKLQLAMPDAAQTAWQKAMLNTAHTMSAQQAANTVWALGKVQHQVPDDVRASLLATSEQSAAAAGVQELQQVLEGLAVLQWPTTSPFREAWLEVAQRAAPSMASSRVSSTTQLLGKLQWQLDSRTHAALLQAAERANLSDTERASACATLESLIS